MISKQLVIKLKNLELCSVPTKCLPSIVLYTRKKIKEFREIHKHKHEKKLTSLSLEQERPLFNIRNSVICLDLDVNPPSYVLQTLSLGPRNAILDKFNPKDVLTELDILIKHCKSHNISDEVITDINIKTLAYIKKCKKQQTSRNITMTKRYLKERDLLAVPFDKGIGICLMKVEDYKKKMSDIINLPQLEKVLPKRKNEKHTIFKEEERISESLKLLRDNDKIDEQLYLQLKPRGSQPAKLYGLAKVHKHNTPVRPVLSMPGSPYHKIAVQITKWLSVVEECKTNGSTKSVADSLKDIHLDNDECLVSFDVTSLYTNVPVEEAIDICTDYLYSGKYKVPPILVNKHLRYC